MFDGRARLVKVAPVVVLGGFGVAAAAVTDPVRPGNAAAAAGAGV